MPAEVLTNTTKPQAEKVKESPFWVSVTRKSKFRRLHVRNGCGVFSWKVGMTESCWSVQEARADAVCKDCAKQMEGATSAAADLESASGSSSSSESETTEVVTATADGQGVGLETAD